MFYFRLFPKIEQELENSAKVQLVDISIRSKVLNYLKENNHLTIDTYLMYVLSNKKIYKTDITNASRTMLFNINTLSWDNYLLDLFDIPESMLPEVSNSDESFGTLSDFNNINVNAVLGDQQAALFGQGGCV